MGKHFWILFACLALVVIPALPVFAGEEVPAIEDDALRRDLYLSERPRLDGLGLGNRSAVVCEQTEVNKTMRPADDGSLTALGEDFNRKTEKPARLSKDKLMANLPKESGVRIITDEEMSELFRNRDGWDRFRQKYPFAGGIKGFSRAGFDPARTQAVVFVSHQADYRMGVGYWIYLEKSASSGKWIISGSRLAHIS